jgi:hypothetical protein
MWHSARLPAFFLRREPLFEMLSVVHALIETNSTTMTYLLEHNRILHDSGCVIMEEGRILPCFLTARMHESVCNGTTAKVNWL